jgi:hypothetical protein
VTEVNLISTSNSITMLNNIDKYVGPV